jgi:hypothetical protein
MPAIGMSLGPTLGPIARTAAVGVGGAVLAAAVAAIVNPDEGSNAQLAAGAASSAAVAYIVTGGKVSQAAAVGAISVVAQLATRHVAKKMTDPGAAAVTVVTFGLASIVAIYVAVR